MSLPDLPPGAVRVTAQHQLVLWHLSQGRRTVRQIAKAMGASHGSTQARLHDLEALQLITVGRHPETGHWLPGTMRPATPTITAPERGPFMSRSLWPQLNSDFVILDELNDWLPADPVDAKEPEGHPQSQED